MEYFTSPPPNTDCSEAHFKKDLFNYYLYLIKSVYEVDTPRPARVCVLSATLAAIEQLARSFVLLIFYRSPPQFCFCISVFFVFSSKVLSFLLVVLLIFFFFSRPRSGAFSVSDPGLLARFINK